MKILSTHPLDSFICSAIDMIKDEILSPFEVRAYQGGIEQDDLICTPMTESSLTHLVNDHNLTLTKTVRPSYFPKIFFKKTIDDVTQIIILKEEVPFFLRVFKKLPENFKVVTFFDHETMADSDAFFSHKRFLKGMNSTDYNVSNDFSVISFGVFRASRSSEMPYRFFKV